MNILKKIENFAKDNNSEFAISGSQKTKIYFGKADKNVYKIISCGNNKELFKLLLSRLVQDKTKCSYFEQRIFGFFAIYNDENFTLHIETHCEGFNTICVYKK